MKSRKEVAERLDRAMADFRHLNEVYGRTSFDDPIIGSICDDLTAVEAEINTLRWVLDLKMN